MVDTFYVTTKRFAKCNSVETLYSFQTNALEKHSSGLACILMLLLLQERAQYFNWSTSMDLVNHYIIAAKILQMPLMWSLISGHASTCSNGHGFNLGLLATIPALYVILPGRNLPSRNGCSFLKTSIFYIAAYFMFPIIPFEHLHSPVCLP